LTKMKHRSMCAIHHALLLLALIFCFFGAVGCVSLPNVKELMHRFPAGDETSEISGTTGPVSPAESKAIIEKLKRQAEISDFLVRETDFIEAVSKTPLTSGNKVILLDNVEKTLDAMLDAIAGASNHINLETYAFKDDRVGRLFSNVLLKKQAEGVQVNIIYDSFGSRNTLDDFFERLRAGGIRVVQFNPINPLNVRAGWCPTHRDHRKILVVDGRIAFTGGINIENVASYAYKGIKKEWKDADVRIEGPAVAEFQKLFLITWAEQKGPRLRDRDFFPLSKAKGDDLVQVIGSTPGKDNRLTFIMYVSAIDLAHHSAHFTTPYFVPDKELIEALRRAAERGVDVKLILPRFSDHQTVTHAGRYYYAHLLKRGVKLYEIRKFLLHSKFAVIDGVWSTVGSTNMDMQSFQYNNEVNAIILGRDFAEVMEQAFVKDLQYSDRLHLENWEKRSSIQRMREWFAHLLWRWF
jgi:cardiolipin synthase